MLNKTLSKKDIIDFDSFISKQSGIMDGEEERQLYLNHIEPKLSPNQKNNREKIISLWVNAKRKFSTEPSPGELFSSGARLIFILFALSGLLTGMGAAVSYLSYSGTEPVNIAIYFFVFVFSQMFLLILSLITIISSKFNLFSDFFSTPYSLALRLIRKTISSGSEKLPAEKRMKTEASIGNIKISKQKFGSLYFWTIFKIFQFTGLMFSTGVLIATLFKVITSDLAFGWQTTLQTAPEKVFDMVRLVAIPWSWVVSPETAYPDLKNIEGSQILLKEGIVNLVSADMASWWPFLCFAVIFYTILPRLLLFSTGIFLEGRALKIILTGNRSTDRLLQLLTSPRMIFERAAPETEKGSDSAEQIRPLQNKGSYTSEQTVIALIPDDSYSADFINNLAEKARKNIGIIDETIQITGDVDEDKSITSSLKEKFKPDSAGVVLIVYEAWMPPIKETLNYIQDIRKQSEDMTRIVIWLTGKPTTENGGYSDVTEEAYNIWHLKIQAMGDACITITRDGE